MIEDNRRPTSFWAIAGLGLIWNIFGLMSFIGWAFISDQQLQKMTEEQVALYESIPSWLLIFFGCAVITGVLGVIAMIFKKKIAVLLLLISMITAIIHQGYSLAFTNAIEVNGGTWGIIMPLFIIAVTIFLWTYARLARHKGWLA